MAIAPELLGLLLREYKIECHVSLSTWECFASSTYQVYRMHKRKKYSFSGSLCSNSISIVCAYGSPATLLPPCLQLACGHCAAHMDVLPIHCARCARMGKQTLCPIRITGAHLMLSHSCTELAMLATFATFLSAFFILWPDQVCPLHARRMHPSTHTSHSKLGYSQEGLYLRAGLFRAVVGHWV